MVVFSSADLWILFSCFFVCVVVVVSGVNTTYYYYSLQANHHHATTSHTQASIFSTNQSSHTYSSSVLQVESFEATISHQRNASKRLLFP
jgi:hypothetical protein